MLVSTTHSNDAGSGDTRRSITLLDLRRYRFTLLLAALVLLLLVSPVLEASALGTLWLTLSLSMVLLAAVFAASGRHWTFWVAFALAAPWIYLTWLHPLWQADATDLAASFLLVCLGLFVLGVVLSDVFRAPQVGADSLCGAIAAYLLIAVVWATSYAVIEALVPGSFGLDDQDPETLWSQLLYFSLVTLTTLGYGDITPAGGAARLWSALESVVGTLYLTILIARLVSLYNGPSGGAKPAQSEAAE